MHVQRAGNVLHIISYSSTDCGEKWGLPKIANQGAFRQAKVGLAHMGCWGLAEALEQKHWIV